jgi:hypothetical protein
MLTHGLLPPEKLEKVQSQLGTTVTAAAGPAAPAGRSPPDDRIARLESQVADLVARLNSLEQDLGR